MRVVKQYGILPKVQCLPARLNQVFLNILMNAAQAIDKDGTITLQTGAQDEEIWISISDTGKGIPAEHLERIFEPFFTTKPPGEGTGLGLSLSYSIVRRHRGRIEVKSSPGRGTTFTVHLPVRGHADANDEP
jgi:two-component system NtrC family sensor kinase